MSQRTNEVINHLVRSPFDRRLAFGDGNDSNRSGITRLQLDFFGDMSLSSSLASIVNVIKLSVNDITRHKN